MVACVGISHTSLIFKYYSHCYPTTPDQPFYGGQCNCSGAMFHQRIYIAVCLGAYQQYCEQVQYMILVPYILTTY